MGKRPRQHWGSRIGVVLATAGNAVGLGNLLRFPSKVALYGGGAFMIPYLISLVLLGLPLMWVEWMAGRFGGSKGHGSTVGIIGMLFKSYRARVIGRLLGVVGVAAPILIIMYYIYIESWTLGFSLSALFGWLPEPVRTADTAEALKPFGEFLSQYTRPSLFAYSVFWITVLLNWYVLQRGIRYGIEVLAKYGMPLLLVMAVFLMVVVLLAKGSHPEWTALKGLEFIWKPDFSKITDARVWVEAAGQIFFTLSLGMGAIATYASYVKEKDDIVVTGMATASTNEFVEVVLGSAIAIPAAFVFFGPASIPELAQAGTFRIGFMSMPAALNSLPLGNLYSFVWFFLLFIAAFTSSVALIQPMIAFLEDELKWSHTRAVAVSMAIVVIGAHFSIFLPKFIDELDFWAGSFMLILFGLLEVVLFVWIFGPERFHEEINRGAQIKLPKWVPYLTGTVSLAFLAAITFMWITQNVQDPKMLITGDVGQWAARLVILALVAWLAFMAVVSTPKGEGVRGRGS